MAVLQQLRVWERQLDWVSLLQGQMTAPTKAASTSECSQPASKDLDMAISLAVQAQLHSHLVRLYLMRSVQCSKKHHISIADWRSGQDQSQSGVHLQSLFPFLRFSR